MTRMDLFLRIKKSHEKYVEFEDYEKTLFRAIDKRGPDDSPDATLNNERK